MGIFNWRKEKKKTKQPTHEKVQTEEERLYARGNQIIRDSRADLKRTEERQDEEVKYAEAVNEALRQTDESRSHHKNMAASSEQARKLMGEQGITRTAEAKRVYPQVFEKDREAVMQEREFWASWARFITLKKRIKNGKDIPKDISQGKEENVQEGESASIEKQVRIYNKLPKSFRDLSELEILFLHEKKLRYGERKSFG